eukprot:SAG11_NODE_366_length_10128_cov_4.162030_11_plen_89_part_00
MISGDTGTYYMYGKTLNLVPGYMYVNARKLETFTCTMVVLNLDLSSCFCFETMPTWFPVFSALNLAKTRDNRPSPAHNFNTGVKNLVF